MMGEERLPVVGYEDRYIVSNFGEVWSLDHYDRRGVFHHGQLLKLSTHEFGYPVANLKRDNVQRSTPVHVLIAAAFIGPRPEGHQVRHLDGISQNTYLMNLDYGTRKQNQQDMARHGRAGRYQAAKTHCPQGHEYTEENTYIYHRPPRREGGMWSTERSCKKCPRERKLNRGTIF